ncbi:MAG: molecular chaperone [Eggerthellaceae bacterium]
MHRAGGFNDDRIRSRPTCRRGSLLRAGFAVAVLRAERRGGGFPGGRAPVRGGAVRHGRRVRAARSALAGRMVRTGGGRAARRGRARCVRRARQALKREWFRLFVGAGAPDAPCWESYYTEPNSQMFGERTLEVRAAYRRHGLQIERLHAEPDDHLGLMLGFMAHLCGAEADALAGDSALPNCAPAGGPGKHVLPGWHLAYEVASMRSDYRGVELAWLRTLRAALRDRVRRGRAGVHARSPSERDAARCGFIGARPWAFKIARTGADC